MTLYGVIAHRPGREPEALSAWDDYRDAVAAASVCAHMATRTRGRPPGTTFTVGTVEPRHGIVGRGWAIVTIRVGAPAA